MTIRLLIIIGLTVGITSCDKNQTKRILVDDVIAEGNITEDTVYNDLIRFYDTSNNRLISVANYDSGVLNGKQIDYFPDSKIKAELNYENGKVNGKVIFSDSVGDIDKSQNFYYDLLVGPSIEYKDGNISKYTFYSFDKKDLFSIDYDTIQGKTIEQLNNYEFFFWNIINFNNSQSSKPQKELFVYLPNPPKFNFKYSLCIIDDAYKIKQTVKEFDTDKIWETVTLEYDKLNDSYMYALKLTVENETDDKERIETFFKKL
jgi:antitoxin component YwqK of YwqJK toxin-antitoxin module